MGLTTAWLERHVIGAGGAAFDFSFVQRAQLAGHVVWFYLAKLIWPCALAFNYPRWSPDATKLIAWLPLTGGLLLTWALWRLRDRARAPLAAWLFFVGTLFPVLGFFNVYPFQYSFVADHFQYLAGIGPFVLLAASLTRLSVRGFLRVALPMPLAFLAVAQTAMFHDTETLFRATFARNPASWMACNNLGEMLMKRDASRPEAIHWLERSLALRPDYAEAHNNLGLALTQAGRPGEAMPHLAAAARLKPGMAEPHNNLGIALARSGRPEEALREFRHAAALAPDVPNIQENWVKALLLLGRRAEADEHFARAKQLRGGP
jgi:tetratricopeptide (TPR) repeat protein